jgi:ABC-2 type transport system ATP-binding protein
VILEVPGEQVGTTAERLGTISDSVAVDGHHVRGRVPRAGRAVPGLIRDLESGGVQLESIEIHRPTLDDVFLTLTGRSLRDAESGADEAVEAEPPGAAAESDTATALEGADR